MNNKENEIVCGYCDKSKKQIWINTNQTQQMIIETFLHECFHSMAHETSIDQAPGFTADLEEIVCDNFSKGIQKLFQEILENKKNLIKK